MVRKGKSWVVSYDEFSQDKIIFRLNCRVLTPSEPSGLQISKSLFISHRKVHCIYPYGSSSWHQTIYCKQATLQHASSLIFYECWFFFQGGLFRVIRLLEVISVCGSSHVMKRFQLWFIAFELFEYCEFWLPEGIE